MSIRTKICGMTRIEDVQLAAELGVDVIGLIFYAGSKRCIDIATAQKLVRELPPFMSATALFVNADAHDVWQVLSEVPIDILQFHGDESGKFCRQFHRPYLKAIRVQNQASINAALTDYSDARALLLDAAVQHTYGGTGQTFDWQCIPKSLPQPWILSGGLNPENIIEAIEKTNTLAVDVCSGVEEYLGVKSEQKMRLLMQRIAMASKSIG